MTTTSEQGAFTFDLRRHLIRAGVIDEHGINQRPRPRRCACGATVLAAWANGHSPTITVDPVALTPLGELQALLAGRTTWQDWREGLDRRRPTSINDFPAGSSKHQPVRPEHVCHSGDVFDAIPEKPKSQTFDQPPF